MKKMMTFTLVGAAVLLAAGAFSAPDEKSQALLGVLKQKVADFGEYRVEFTVAIDGQILKGSYEVSGGSYRVVTPDIVVYCDGKTKYEVSLLDKEVTVDNTDPNDRTVLGNPTRLFDFLDGTYTHRYVGAAVIGGVNCERIELTETGPKGTGAANGQQAEVFVSTSTGLPVRLTYKMGMLNTEAVIDVARITPRITLDRTVFNFDAARYKGFEIIDFR